MTEQDILIMNSDSTHVDVELSFDNVVEMIKNNGIYSESMSLSDSISDSESIVFGKCNISQFQVKVADFEGNIDGALMNVLLKFSSAELGECEYNLGQYIVSDSERTSDKMFRIITAYDKMSLFNKDIANWYNYTLFPFEVVDNNLGWLPVNENGVVIDLTYSVAGEPQTSLDINDNGAYYLNTNDGIVYVGYATYDESGEFASVEWRTYLQCEKNESYTEVCNVKRTVNEILAMLCEYVGVPYNEDFVLVNGGITVGRDFNPQSLNGLDFLQQICELNGVFGHINNNGILDFIAPDKSTKQTVDTFKKCDYSDYTVQPINSVSIKHDSNDIGTTVTRPGIDKLNQYKIVGNIFLQSIKREDELNAIAEKILSVIENITYVPCSVEVKCGLNFGLGDYITVNAKTIKEESVSSVSFDTLVLCRNISGIQSIFNRIEANGTEYVNKNAESLSSQIQITNKTIDKLYKEYTANVANFMHLYSKAITTDSLSANIANIGTLNANSAFVKFLQTNVVDANYIKAVTADIGYLVSSEADLRYASITNLESLQASFNILNAKAITTDNLKTETAKIGYLESNAASLGRLMADSGLIEDLVVTEDAKILGTLKGLTIKGDVIEANTISAKSLIIREDDEHGDYKNGLIYQINATASGLDATELSKEEYRDKISGQDLIANSVTADRIDTDSLCANEAFLNKVFAQDITATGSITGAELIGGKTKSSDINFGNVELSKGRLMSLQNNLPETGSVTYITQGGLVNRWYYELPSFDGGYNDYDYGREVWISHGEIHFKDNKDTEENESVNIYAGGFTSESKYEDGTDKGETFISSNYINLNMYFKDDKTKYYGTVVTSDSIIQCNNIFGEKVETFSISNGILKTIEIYENGTSLSEKYAPISHSHSYLPLSGGTLTGPINMGSGNLRIGQESNNLYLGNASNKGWLLMQDAKSQATNCGWVLHQAGSMEILNHLTVGTITAQNIYTVGVNGTLNATTIYENGTLLSSKYIPNSNKYTVNGVSHTGWFDIDQSKVPTLNFLSFWNGAHTSDGNSNLSYCNRGAFGTIVTKSASDYLPITGGTLTGNLISNGGSLYSKSGVYECSLQPRVLIINNTGDKSGDYYIQFRKGSRSGSYWTRLTCSNVTANRTLTLPNTGGTLSVSSSDIRLKDNVKDTEVENAIDVIKQIKLRSFDWNDGSHPHQKIGFVADELEEIDSRLAVGGGWDMTTDPEGNEEKVMNVKTVDTFYMMGYVVKAIQELSEQIKKLKDA